MHLRRVVTPNISSNKPNYHHHHHRRHHHHHHQSYISKSDLPQIKGYTVSQRMRRVSRDR